MYSHVQDPNNIHKFRIVNALDGEVARGMSRFVANIDEMCSEVGLRGSVGILVLFHGVAWLLRTCLAGSGKPHEEQSETDLVF